MTDHLTLCSEERLRELLLAEKELSSLKAERDLLKAELAQHKAALDEVQK